MHDIVKMEMFVKNVEHEHIVLHDRILVQAVQHDIAVLSELRRLVSVL